MFLKLGQVSKQSHTPCSPLHPTQVQLGMPLHQATYFVLCDSLSLLVLLWHVVHVPVCVWDCGVSIGFVFPLGGKIRLGWWEEELGVEDR